LLLVEGTVFGNRIFTGMTILFGRLFLIDECLCCIWL